MKFASIIYLNIACSLFSLGQSFWVEATLNEWCFGDANAEVAGVRFLVTTPTLFSEASPDSPIYIRIVAPNRLSKTLVDLESSATGFVPISIPISSGCQSSSVVARPDAVEIVRAIEGERSLWLRVSQGSSEWLRTENEIHGPQVGAAARWTLPVFHINVNTPLHHPFPAPSAAVDYTYLVYGEASGVTTAASDLDIYLGAELIINLGNDFRAGNVFECNKLLFPWVTNNSQYESKLVLFNPNDEAIALKAKAQRMDGSYAVVMLELGAKQQMVSNAADIFSDLGPGAGFSVAVECPNEVAGAWSIARKGHGGPPSMLNALRPRIGIQDIGNYIIIRPTTRFMSPRMFFPSVGPNSAIVMLNTGYGPGDITLTLYTTEGQSLGSVDFEDIPLWGPQAFMVRDLFPDVVDVGYAIGESTYDNLAGLIFTFDESGQTSYVLAESIFD